MVNNVKKLSEGLDLEMFDKDIGIKPGEDENGDIDDFKNLSTNQDLVHDYNRDKVRQELRRAGANGATSSEISKLTGLNTQTAKKYLDELCAIREAYRLKRNRLTTIYYINGKPRHDFGVDRIEDGNLAFEISLAEGPDESLLLHIIEKRFTLLDGEQIEGGVIIPLKLIQSVMESLNKYKELGG